MKAHLLIIDDDANTLASLARAFRLAGHEATVCDNPVRALEMVRSEKFDLIFSDVVMPGMDGLALLEQIKAAGVKTPVVMMSGQAHIEMAVRATRLGAVDFLEKPLSTDKLLLTVQNALRIERLEQENRQLRHKLGETQIVYTGEKMRKLMAQVARVASSESRVCILGETGTGKELIARAIHKRSKRAARAFIRVNCGAIAPSLIASELFGHEKGAFTGAFERRIGHFEAADGGTIFLDEIGDLPLDTQSSLLRVLQERELQRVGSSKPVEVDVRVLAATNRDLRSSVDAGKFREDLFYRLNVFPIRLPPLRERADDISLLVEYLIGRYTKKAGKRFENITSKTLELFQAYHWPGNIRELQNVIERAVILCDGATFSVDKSWLKESAPASGPVVQLVPTLADREREMIEAALAQSRGRISGPTGAAAKLGIPRQTLDRKLLSLGIDKYRFKTL
jgi:two-component system, NtrC family, nitrogen regulation response regulator NtrX